MLEDALVTTRRLQPAGAEVRLLPVCETAPFFSREKTEPVFVGTHATPSTVSVVFVLRFVDNKYSDSPQNPFIKNC